MSRPTTRSSRTRIRRETELLLNDERCAMDTRCRKADCDDRNLPVTVCSEFKSPVTKKYQTQRNIGQYE